ncbi:hypothetical protein VE00_03184 [Pseudogymnoascus sp. WSF 3629]|nr:hypothetical protein VE00_03184 [Pseudogymnoascus sp. WSF 3629]
MEVLTGAASSALPRSHSSSNLPTRQSSEFKHIRSTRDSEELPRSASFTFLPGLDVDTFKLNDYFDAEAAVEPFKLCRTSSEATITDKGHSKHGGSKTQEQQLQAADKRKSTVSGWVSRVRGSPERTISLPWKAPTDRTTQSRPIPIRTASTRSTASQSRAQFDDSSSSRSSSRSPSPSKKLVSDLMGHSPDDLSTPPSSISSSSPKQSLATLSIRSGLSKAKIRSESPGAGLVRRGTQLLKRSKKVQSSTFDDGSSRSSNTSSNSLGGISTLNINGLATPATSRPSSRGLKGKLAPLAMHSAQKKDELWPAFCSLDSDFRKFQTKTSALKAQVVRSTLLPFLRNDFYHDHPSTRNLEPEHLDRRVNVLDKWWIGLLDMIDTQNGMSGVDRPVILEAMAEIMARPEWRLPPSLFAPLGDKPAPTDMARSHSTGSFSSSSSGFVTDSVYHNVRTTFIRNLNAQMSTIVEKMSLRHAPASLVTFCGKATAYAFFFCPGVADALVRVWRTPLETVNRVADEFGLPRRYTSPSGGSDDIVEAFPPNLQMLGWTSAKTLSNQLQRPAKLPLEVAKIEWGGAWAGRWCGRDSDLFYVFCKHYHILMEEFVPADTPLIEKARAPAFVLVHAQIVTVLDGTFNRKPAAAAGSGPISLLGGSLAGADASAAALPLLPSSNLARLMCENRLIMLVRDFLSEQPQDVSEARRTFAESFALSLKAATKRTSVYNHNACSILCDFLEEVLPIYLRYNTTNSFHIDCIDWWFWLDVCQKMLESDNQMTEIRLLSFVYTTWNILTVVDARKEVVCLDWLLSEPTFEKLFMHWSPMVRAYFMRLLCWRICRFENDATQLETQILSTVSSRLKRIWSYYQHQKHTALHTSTPIPSSTPCLPAPGRRLLIIRNETHPPPPNHFLSFDGIISGSPRTPSPTRRNSTAPSPPSPADSTGPRRRWSILGKINPFIADPNAPPQPTTLEAARLATAASRSPSTSFSPPLPAPSPSPPTPTYRAFSFRFSLEWHGGHMQSASDRRIFGRDRVLGVPRLPGAAQTFLLEAVEGAADEVPGVAGGSRYAGRALAEWEMVARELEGFVERRFGEGVPSLGAVEVPELRADGRRW